MIKLVIVWAFVCVSQADAQKFTPVDVSFKGIEFVTGIMHLVVKTDCRQKEGTFSHGLGASLRFISNRLKSPRAFKGCEVTLDQNELYVIEGLGSETTFLAHSNLISSRIGKELLSIFSNPRNLFASDTTTVAFHSDDSKTMTVAYYSLCQRPMLIFELSSDDLGRLFDSLLTTELRVRSSQDRVRVGMIFNGDIDLQSRVMMLRDSQ